MRFSNVPLAAGLVQSCRLPKVPLEAGERNRDPAKVAVLRCVGGVSDAILEGVIVSMYINQDSIAVVIARLFSLFQQGLDMSGHIAG